jgi:hypothetical protein
MIRADFPLTNREKALSVFLWIWTAVATLAFTYQFRAFVRPIIELLGLS